MDGQGQHERQPTLAEATRHSADWMLDNGAAGQTAARAAHKYQAQAWGTGGL